MPRPTRVPITAATVGLMLALAGCERRAVELGFWIEPVVYSSARLGGQISLVELKTIERIARSEIEQAFQRFEVTVTGNHEARFSVVVVPALKDNRLVRGGTHAGESRAVAGFGGSGNVSFEYLANGAMVFAPDDASRAEVIAALGRGIGRVAIHEFLHQLLPKFALHDSKDKDSYEGNSPALIEGYFGDLHWDIAGPALEARLKRR